MKIHVKRNSPFKEVRFVDGSTTIESGLLNDDEMKSLAKELREAADELWLEDEE